MKLNFLGRGAAFNPKEGNTSAYFIENNELYLIDCGGSIFDTLKNKGILDQVSKIHTMITHTHADHAGSLGTLVLYSYYVLHQPLTIIIDLQTSYKDSLISLLTLFGCQSHMFEFVDMKEYDNRLDSFKTVRFVRTTHCEELVSHSLVFETNDGHVFYSGDTNDINYIKNFIQTNKHIDKLYIDTCSSDFPGNVHCYIGKLKNIIPEELKDKIYCMHLGDDKCIELAHEYGFHVVEKIN